MKKTFVLSLLVLVIIVANTECKRSLSRSRGSSSRTSSRSSSKYSSQPAQAPAPAQKPSSSLFGWQESKSAQKASKKTNTNQRPSNTNTQSHSYPSSNTGLSGSKQAQWQPVQKSNVPQNSKQPDTKSHSYPSSNSGLSGSGQAKPPPSYQESVQRSNSPHNTASNPLANPGSSGHGYPQQQGRGLSGSSGTGYPHNNQAGNTYQHPQPPPPYSQPGYGNPSHGGQGGYGAAGGYGAPGGYGPPGGYGAPGAYGGHGAHGGYGGYGGHGNYNPGYASQMPGYFGNYGNKGFGGVGRTGNVLTGVGIAGAGIGTVLTGLALWNLARSTGKPHHTVIYDNQGAPVAVAPLNATEAVVQDSFLANLVNCTLTIDSGKSAEVLAIPCAIATSFSPEADIKDIKNANPNDTTKCTITVVTKEEKEFMTTVPCSILLNTAAENNVTEPTATLNGTESFTTIAEAFTVNVTYTPVPEKMSTELRQTTISNPSTLPSLNCTSDAEVMSNSTNPCINEDLTVLPLPTTEKQP